MTRQRITILTCCVLWSLTYVVSCLIRTDDQDALLVVQVFALLGAVWSARGMA